MNMNIFELEMRMQERSADIERAARHAWKTGTAGTGRNRMGGLVQKLQQLKARAKAHAQTQIQPTACCGCCQ